MKFGRQVQTARLFTLRQLLFGPQGDGLHGFVSGRAVCGRKVFFITYGLDFWTSVRYYVSL